MALAAFGAIGISGAQAAEETFHCSVGPCTLTLQKDGTGPTAHQVFGLKGETYGRVKGASIAFTCDQVTGKGTVNAKTATEAAIRNFRYDGCKWFGQEFPTDFNSCGYKFTSTGGGTVAGSQLHLEYTNREMGSNSQSKDKLPQDHTIYSGRAQVPRCRREKEVLTVTISNIGLPAAAVDIVNAENAICKA